MASDRICSIEGCGKPHNAYGLCAKHRYRQRRFGDPLEKGRTSAGEVLEWLESHKDYDGADCLTWPFALTSEGYGRLCFRGTYMRASRAMCILANGEPPFDSADAAHSCGHGDQACVHPTHVRWATRQENHDDTLLHGTRLRGSKRPNARLTDDVVSQIRRRVSAGEAQSEIAQELNVSRATVNDAVLGRTWQHVT